jgi:hypothetical protein
MVASKQEGRIESINQAQLAMERLMTALKAIWQW